MNGNKNDIDHVDRDGRYDQEMVDRREMTLKEIHWFTRTKQLHAARRIIRCSSGYLSAGPLHQFNADVTRQIWEGTPSHN
jgi:hypothetical protein